MSARPEVIQQLQDVIEAQARGFISFNGANVTYHLGKKKSYVWTDPEEWVRCAVIAYLILQRGYPPHRMETEVRVPRRVPSDYADVVVFRDDSRRDPFLVVECKADSQTKAARTQGIEQAIGNANSLRAPYALYDEWGQSVLFDTSGTYGAMERVQNRRGDRTRTPSGYTENQPTWKYIAGDRTNDIQPATASALESKVRATHSLIWSGGRRDPLTSFDEWSKLLFAKVHDERTTPNGQPRRFQIGSGETATLVASRVHGLFAEAAETDKTIFPAGTRINLPDEKIYNIVEALHDISIINTDTDTIGRAFEEFFGSVFRGELGQYFTMRLLARFMVAAVDLQHTDYVIDPTAGSGGFLLESLLQGWRVIDEKFDGQTDQGRLKYDFAKNQVHGIEINPTLARILKINLLLHHDGHTNIEADKSCLDTAFTTSRLRNNWKGGFHVVLGNPPFGDTVKEGDADHLGENTLESFTVAEGREQVPSEHVILERSIDMLKDGGRLAFVLPDGVLNNQGEGSNCPNVRRFIASKARIEAVVSLPDFAFRKSGAQNKTSILFLRKFTASERSDWATAHGAAKEEGLEDDAAVAAALSALDYPVFLAEPSFIGYTPSGQLSEKNDLYRADAHGLIADDQAGTVLGELRKFQADPSTYQGAIQPDCMTLSISAMWNAHPSHRLDPKYFLFKNEAAAVPNGWTSKPIGKLMKRRLERVRPEEKPDKRVVVLTLSQTGELSHREAGKGKNPPEWLGAYFEDSPTHWYRVRTGDVVFSSIDLWKGCIAVVPPEFDKALVSKEFPIYKVKKGLDPGFLSTLLRSRYYQRAFRAITTGHSNRRRTQAADFENLDIWFPPDLARQKEIASEVLDASAQVLAAQALLRQAMLAFSDVIDNRGDEELPTFEDTEAA